VATSPVVPQRTPTAARYQTGTERGRFGRDSARKNRVQLAAERINTPRANKVTSLGRELDRKDDLSHLFAGVQSFVGGAGILEGEGLVNHRLQTASEDKRHDFIEVRPGRHGRSQNG